MNHLTIESLPYQKDMVQHYQALRHLPGFVLLESIDQSRGRYDIVTAFPYDVVKIRRGADLSRAYEDIQQRMPQLSLTLNYPFFGGAIGYFSYDFGALLSGIPIPEPHPTLSDLPLVDLGFYDWAIVVCHQTKTTHLLSAHQCSETKMIIEKVKHDWFNAQPDRSYRLESTFKPQITEAYYHQAFNDIHRHLYSGRTYQVNLTQPFVAQYTGDPWEVYKVIRQKNPVPYAAFISGEGVDVLSFSPERLLLVDSGKVVTSPIKGTMRRSDNAEMDEKLRAKLLSSEKNRAENVMIVDLLRNDLGKIAQPGSVKVTSLCEIQSYHGVHHLVSDIEALVKDGVSPLDVFFSCFPGGSITGAPKREAMRIIAEQEPVSRGIYCGSIGYLSSHGRFDSNIAIRTLTATQNHLHLAAGGGIVIDSLWDDEYQECLTKIQAIAMALGFL